jgi:hypothetical protein
MIEEKTLELIIFYILVGILVYFFRKYFTTDLDQHYFFYIDPASVMNYRYVKKEQSFAWECIEALAEYLPRNNIKR